MCSIWKDIPKTICLHCIASKSFDCLKPSFHKMYLKLLIIGQWTDNRQVRRAILQNFCSQYLMHQVHEAIKYLQNCSYFRQKKYINTRWSLNCSTCYVWQIINCSQHYKYSELGFSRKLLHQLEPKDTLHSFFYKNVIFRVQAQNFLKNYNFSFKKLLVLNFFPGSKLS